MTNSSKLIVVLGATGQQGGATVKHLLSDGWHVAAFVRNPSSPAAQALAASGARLVRGDMRDAASLEAAFAGAYGVFSVQPPSWQPSPETDAEEVRLGHLAANAAKAAGIRHIVYTSVLGAESQFQFGRTNHKREIETHLWSIGLPGTVLRPAGFMENLFLPAYGLASGSLFDPTAHNVRVALIAVDDIGRIAADVFGDPARFIGGTLNLAGDMLTPPQIAERVSQAVGRAISHVPVAIDVLRAQNKTLAAMYEWLNVHGYPSVDVAALRTIHPGLQTFDKWLAASAGQKLRAMIG